MSSRAFTLLEAVATISIISIVAVVASRSVFAAADGYASAASRAELVESMSAAMDRIVTEVRSVPLRPVTTPAQPYIDSVTDSSLGWGTGGSLSLSGTDLRLGVSGSAFTLLEGVTTLTLDAYDQDNALLALPLAGSACAAVRRVQVRMTATRYGVTEMLRTKVFLRCMTAGASP